MAIWGPWLFVDKVVAFYCFAYFVCEERVGVIVKDGKHYIHIYIFILTYKYIDNDLSL